MPASTGAFQPATASISNLDRDGYVVRIREDLSQFIQSTFFGGAGNDGIDAVQVHPFTFNVYVSGISSSTTINAGSTPGAFPSNPGLQSGFIARMTPDLTAIDKTPNMFAFPARLGVIQGDTVISVPARVEGFTGTAAVYLTGGPDASYCISSLADCRCDIQAFTRNPATINSGEHICMSNVAPLHPRHPEVSTIHVGGGAANFVVITGVAPIAPCSIDVDLDGKNDALTDGLIILRALFGLTGTAVTNQAIGETANRTTFPQIRQFLNDSCGLNLQP